MKSLILLAMITLSAPAFAFGPKATHEPLRPCTEDAAFDLTEEHAEWSETFYMLNANGQIVGVYSYKDDQIHAAVCDYLSSDELTVANEWYYWQEEGSANPQTFTVNSTYWMAQDEGLSSLFVKKASATGEITAAFTVVGWDGEGHEHNVRADIVTFKKVY